MQVLPSTGYYEPAPNAPLLSGIILAIVPASTPGFGVEIQRTSDVGGGIAASSAAISLAIIEPPPGAGVPYFDPLPVDGAKRFYRARETEAGWTPSAYTAWTTGHKPVQLSQKDILLAQRAVTVYPVRREMLMNDGQMTLAANDTGGAQPSSGLYMPSTQKIAVGLLVGSSFVTKILNIGFHEFVAVSPGPPPNYGDGAMASTGLTGGNFRAPIANPPFGASLTANALSATVNTSTSETGSITLHVASATDPTNRNVMASVSLTAATSQISVWRDTLPSANAIATFTTDKLYEATVNFVTLAQSTSQQVAALHIAYTMPTYDVTR